MSLLPARRVSVAFLAISLAAPTGAQGDCCCRTGGNADRPAATCCVSAGGDVSSGLPPCCRPQPEPTPACCPSEGGPSPGDVAKAGCPACQCERCPSRQPSRPPAVVILKTDESVAPSVVTTYAAAPASLAMPRTAVSMACFAASPPPPDVRRALLGVWVL